MAPLPTAAIAAWALFAASLTACAVRFARGVAYVTLADGRRAERRLPFSIRVLLPLAASLRTWFSSARWAKARTQAEDTIRHAGLEGVLTGREFLAVRLLSPVCFGGAWVVAVGFAAGALPGTFFAQNMLPVMLLGVAFFHLKPALWLKGALGRRHAEIVRALPFVLDLLTLSVEAGMDFMSALQRNCARRKVDALNEELIRMTHEIQLGLPRRVALKNLSARVGQPDLTAFAHALAQADELGVSIGKVLRISSEQLGARRFARAEKLAHEAPVKMLGPLMLCIFPAVFIVLLGPILAKAAQSIF